MESRQAGLVAILALLFGSHAQAAELLWSNSWSNWTTVESVVWTEPAKDVEAADDFDVEGTIERVIVDGNNSCLTVCNAPPVTAVRVRFYQWTPFGPGALQHEATLAAGAPGLLYDADNPALVDVTLPTPFVATGQHFLSIQLEFDGAFYWSMWVANHGSPAGSHLWTRDNGAGGPWKQPKDGLQQPLNDDLYFTLYGCPSGGCAAPPVVADCGQWSDVPSPNPAEFTDARLQGLEVVAPWDVWAVGEFTGPLAGSADHRTQSLAMRWNGSAWSIVPTPSPGPNASTTHVSLNAVSAAGANDAWAVGFKYAQDGGGYLGPRVLALRWDGFTWTDTNVPWPANNDGSVFTGASGEQLYDVAALAPDDVWMVGRYWHEYPSGAIHWPGAAFHWNGSGFELHELPMVSPAKNQVPAAIAVVSPDDIWVVGAGNGTTTADYIWHWNGATWSTSSAPSPGTQRSLDAVVAVAEDDVWAGGWWSDATSTHPWILHWNGTSWIDVPTPAGGSRFAALAADDILTSGVDGFAHWDGTAWTAEAGPEYVPWAGVMDMEYVSPCTLWGVGMKTLPQGYASYTVRLEPVVGGDDGDGDGVADAQDNCPSDFNPDQVDCDGDGAGDVCELIGGSSFDCNGNSTPDDCEVFDDCNANSIPDECEVDCNANSLPDSCDVDGGASLDCNANGVPDECDTFADCNQNGVDDSCDISGGSSADANANGFPDECEALGPSFATVTTIEDVVDFGGGQRLGDLPGPDGLVSFREAVLATNNTAGPQTIAFNIPPGNWGGGLEAYAELRLEAGLFLITDDGTTIDGTTQIAFTGDTNPSGAEIGIYGYEPNGWGVTAILINSDGCTVKGLGRVLQRGYGVQIGGNGNRVIGSHITGPWHAAVSISGGWGGPAASGNLVEGNVLSGGGSGVSITGPAADNIVIGNRITGGSNGVSIDGGATGNRVGGPSVEQRNVIAGAGHYDGEGCPGGAQVEIWGGSGNVIQNNFIGTTPDGTASEGQIGTAGVELIASSNNLVEDNVISGIRVEGWNHCQGGLYGTAISVAGASSGNVFRGNLIGTDASGTQPIPNLYGLSAANFPGSGSPTDALVEGNVIAHSEADGVTILYQASGITLSGNSIHSNGGVGIDLSGGLGNGGQTAPALTAAATDGFYLTVDGTFTSAPNATFTLEFFGNGACDESGFGEGQEPLGTASVTTDAGGQAPFSLTIDAAVLAGTVITATATEQVSGNTSEFSNCITSVVGACTMAPGEVAGLAVSGAEVAWLDHAEGVLYDVARGDVLDLASGLGAECVATGLDSAAYADLAQPVPGTAWYYLVRATNACGIGPWGAGFQGAQREVSCP